MLKSHSPVSSVEKLETRALFSASPVDFAGQYAGGQDNVAYEVSIRQSATVKTSYTGDFLIGGYDLKLAGAESSTSVLKGSITQVDGKPTSFTATLKGNLLTLVSGGETAELAKFSSTPASPLPTMYAGKGKYFSYEAPKGWKVAETANQAFDATTHVVDCFKTDRERITAESERVGSALRVHELLQQHPFVTAGQLVERSGLTMPTINAALAELEKFDIVEEATGRKRGRVFGYRRYLAILNEGTDPLPRTA